MFEERPHDTCVHFRALSGLAEAVELSFGVINGSEESSDCAGERRRERRALQLVRVGKETNKRGTIR